METHNQYNSWHERMAERECVQNQLTFPWHKTVEKLLPPADYKHILEIGCGRGDFSIWLARKYPSATVTAIDFAESAINVAKLRREDRDANVRFEVGNAEFLSFAAGSFDLVISCECMEHVINPQKMADEIFRVLRPGGQFILTTENYFNGMLLAWMKSWLTQTDFNSGSGVQPHENFFLFWQVRKTLERGGLAVKHMESSHFQWLLFPATDPRKLCTEDFSSPFWKRIFRPFGRHFTFKGTRS